VTDHSIQQQHVPKDTITIRELASRLGVSIPTARPLAKKLGIRVGRRLLIPKSAYEAWLANGGEEVSP